MTHTFQKYIESVLGVDAPVVWVLDVHPEQFWHENHPKTILADRERIGILNNLDEALLLMARPQDYIIIRKFPDKLFSKGKRINWVNDNLIVLENGHEHSTPLPNLILDSKNTLSTLTKLKEKHGVIGLIAFGNTLREEMICKKTGLTLLGAPHHICARVNSKAYARQILPWLDIPYVPGISCGTTDDILRAYQTIKHEKPIAVKDSYGVSGKGIHVFYNDSDFKNWLHSLERRASTRQFSVSFVVEPWLDVSETFNHSFILYPDGSHEFLSLKGCVIDKGRHRKHYQPTHSAHLFTEDIQRCHSQLAKHLHAEGYHGIVGLDGIITRNGKCFPVVDINARINWSSLQLPLQNKLPEFSHFRAGEFGRYFEGDSNFEALTHLVNEFDADHGGVVTQCTRTLHINTRAEGKFFGALYYFIFANSAEDVTRFEGKLHEAMSQ